MLHNYITEYFAASVNRPLRITFLLFISTSNFWIPILKCAGNNRFYLIREKKISAETDNIKSGPI